MNGIVFRPRLIAIAIIVAFLLSSLSMQAGAQTATPEPADTPGAGPVFTLRPAEGADLESLVTRTDPGHTTSLTVVLGNQDEKPLTLRTYVADAMSKPNGGFALQEEEAPIHEPTTWIDYSPETLTLEPGEDIERTFTVTVPAGTPAGQYVSGIALQTAEPVEVPGTTLFNQIIRKAVPVFVTVPGPVEPSAELGQPYFEPGTNSSLLYIPIENTGNVLLQPKGHLTLSDTSGTEIVSAPISMRQVYAGHQTVIALSIPPQVLPGDYLVRLDLKDKDTGWTASLSDASVTLMEPPTPEAMPEPDPVEITTASVTPMPDPESGNPPQYANVTVEITNRAQPVSSSRLTMSVFRDGEVVENVVLSESLALLEQTTTVERPWIPKEGWQEGTYTFSLLLESVDPTTGVEVVLASVELPDTIEVPAQGE